METLPRIRVLIEMSAVEVSQPVGIGREVRRHPVEDHGNSVLMQVIHQIHEILRRAVARCGGEISGGLISPGTVEGMLHYRQKFDVGEAHSPHVFGKARRSLAIAKRTIVFFWDTHPRAQMNFVNGLRRAQRVAFGTLLHPFIVAPLITELPHHRRGAGRLLMQKPEWIGFIDTVAVAARLDMKFVKRPLAHIWDKPFPDAGAASRRQ